MYGASVCANAPASAEVLRNVLRETSNAAMIDALPNVYPSICEYNRQVLRARELDLPNSGCWNVKFFDYDSTDASCGSASELADEVERRVDYFRNVIDATTNMSRKKKDRIRNTAQRELRAALGGLNYLSASVRSREDLGALGSVGLRLVRKGR